MNKQFIVLSILLCLIIVSAACGPVTSVATSQTGQTPSPISTGQIFVLTKIGGLTSEAQTEAVVSPKNNATINAIIATKYAGATETAETMTAMLTQTPTPSIPADSPFCTQADLKPSFASYGSTGNNIFGVAFTNTSKMPCYLQAWPNAILVDGRGKPLDIDYGYQDINASESVLVSTEKIGVPPAWEARFDLLWFDYRTWCGTPVPGNLIVQMTLMNNGGVVGVPTDFQPDALHCDVPGTRTSVSITKMYLVPPAVSTPNQIKMVDENNGWMVGGQDTTTNRIFHTSDGGTTWNDVTPQGVTLMGDSPFFFDAQNAWMLSEMSDTHIPTLFHTADGGGHWTSYQQLPFKHASFKFSNANIGWAFADIGAAAGNFYFRLYQTLDGGAHWTQLFFKPWLATDLNLSPGTLHLISGQWYKFLDPSTIWFGGNQMVSTTDITLQVSHDAGKTWSTKHIDGPREDQVSKANMVFYGTPEFITDRDGYLVASYSIPEEGKDVPREVADVIVTHDGGNTWTASPNLIDKTNWWTLHIDFISPNDAFFHCDDSLCVTHDGAQTWTPIPSNFSFAPIDGNEVLGDLDFVNAQVGWAIVYENGANQLIKTTDGGKTWNVQP